MYRLHYEKISGKGLLLHTHTHTHEISKLIDSCNYKYRRVILKCFTFSIIFILSFQINAQTVNVKFWVAQRPVISNPDVLWPSDQNIQNIISDVIEQFSQDGIDMDICYEMISDDFLLLNQENFLYSTCYETAGTIDGFIYPQTNGQNAPGAGQACLPTNWPCPAGRFYSLNASNTIVHELGHVLGLRHTFLGGTPSGCYEQSTSTNGDNIEDTPFHPQPTSLFDNPLAWTSTSIYNELLNPDFEDQTLSPHWQVAGLVSLSNASSSGLQVLQILPQGATVSQTINVPSAGENYLLTVSVSSASTSASFGVEYLDNQNMQLGLFETNPINTTTTQGFTVFQNISLYAQAPVGATAMRIYLKKDSGPSTAKFDNLLLSSVNSGGDNCSINWENINGLRGSNCAVQIPVDHDDNEVLKKNHMSYLDFNTPNTQIPGSNCSWDLEFTDDQVAKMSSEMVPWTTGDACSQSIPTVPGGDYNQNVVFDESEYNIYKDLFIYSTVKFTNTQLNIGPGVKFHVENGGLLIIDETIIETLCDEWLGIDATGSGAILNVSNSTINEAIEGINISSGATINLVYSLISNCGNSSIPGLTLNSANANNLNHLGFYNSDISLTDNSKLVVFNGVKCKDSNIESNNSSLLIHPGVQMVPEFDESNITFTGSGHNLTVDDAYFHGTVNKPITVNSCNDLVICRNWFHGCEDNAIEVSSTGGYQIFHNLVDGVSGDAVRVNGDSGAKSIIQNNVFDNSESNDLDLEDSNVDVSCNFHDYTTLPWNLNSGNFSDQGNDGHPAGNVFDNNSMVDIDFGGVKFDYYHSTAAMEIPDLDMGTAITLITSTEPKSACSPKNVIRANWGNWITCFEWWNNWKNCGDPVKEECIPDPNNEDVECIELLPPTYINPPGGKRVIQDNNQAFNQQVDYTQDISDEMLELRSSSIENHSIQIYPNPLKDELFILNQYSSPVNYTIVNSIGESVMSGVIFDDKKRIDANELLDGLYIVQLVDSVGRVVMIKKIIKI